MAFEQYFYDSVNTKKHLNSANEIEFNIGGPYRKCSGGIGVAGEANCVVQKRKYYVVQFAGEGVVLSMPDKNRYEGRFSGATIVKQGA